MRIRNDSEHWGAVSLALHWLTFVLIIGLAIVGLVMTELPNSPLKISVYAWHKSFGLTVLGLTLLRLGWRLIGPVPAPVPMPAWQRWAAAGTQGVMYVLLLAIPLSGWLYNSAAGFPLKWFGLFSLPKLSGYNPDLKHFAEETHETLFYLLALVILIHAAAALKHHYLDRDPTLRRMLAWRSKPRT
ncbi:MAG TPA: cytochrome b [Arenimonas sp.]|nr:cytochrome b [Arenimonas sp.]